MRLTRFAFDFDMAYLKTVTQVKCVGNNTPMTYRVLSFKTE